MAGTTSYEAHLAIASELEDEARREDKEAEIARQRGPDYQCETARESEETMIGGERLEGTRICDETSSSDERRHKDEAARLRGEANRHRSQARVLRDADRVACEGLSFDVLRDPPLRRYAARARVESFARGARIFLTGGGIDADQLRREIECHRARAALMGHDPEYMPSEPGVVAGAHIRVEVSRGYVVVTIDSEDTTTADLIRQRAEALVGR